VGREFSPSGNRFTQKVELRSTSKDFLKINHVPSAEVQSTPQALERVRQQIRDGADGIKIFSGSITAEGVLPMATDLARAIVSEAHRAGKPVFAHPSNAEGIEVAIQSGVDILAHTAPMSGDWTPRLCRKAKGRSLGPHSYAHVV